MGKSTTLDATQQPTPFKKIGLFGGTFNPIHNGHLHLANCLLAQLKFDEVRFIPSAIPALKAVPKVSAQARADMVQLAIADHPKFSLDTRELARSGKSYTIDTLQSLREEFGENAALFWLMGYDALLGLSKWHAWEKLLDYAHIVVVNRPQAHEKPAPELASWLKAHQAALPNSHSHGVCGKVFFVEIPPADISSSQIRQRLAARDLVNALVPPAVLQYIQSHHFYEEL